MTPLGRISTQTSLLCWMMLDVWGVAWCGMSSLFDFDILHFYVGQGTGFKHWVVAPGRTEGLAASSNIRIGALAYTHSIHGIGKRIFGSWQGIGRLIFVYCQTNQA
jgi:hypothetical protein